MTKYCDGTKALTPCPHPEDCTISCEFNDAVVLRKISTALAAEIMFENDDQESYSANESITPEKRWRRMRRWLESKLIAQQKETK